IVEHSFSQDQSGGLVLFTPKGPFSYWGWPITLAECVQCNRSVESVHLKNNIFRQGCQGVVLNGFDYESMSAGQFSNRVENNLFYDIASDWSGTGTCQALLFGGGNGWRDLEIVHNTGIANSGFYFNRAPSGPLKMVDNLFRFGTFMFGNECN